jgi:hypothetical protein
MDHEEQVLEQEFQRPQRPPELRPFARDGQLVDVRCETPSATASGVVGTSIRDRLVRIGADGRHYPRLKMHGGHLTSDNVRLAHRLCNRRDYEWRTRINAMLAKRMSLEEIAKELNRRKVPSIHGTNQWTASSVRKAFVS